jgi:N-dimethylarginine dimethylaminohydrolase
MSHFDSTVAFLRDLPSSFLDSLKLHPPPVPIDMSRAYEQHASYAQLIKQLVGSIVNVHADENCPDCVFIEVNK